jgi:CheY-like chemotaxis protein
MRTFIFDDEEPIVHMLALVCEKQGHVVLPFCDSADALITLASAPMDADHMHMPGPDGVAVIREARRRQPNLFTLIITGHTEYPVEEMMAAGTADIMFKPFHRCAREPGDRRSRSNVTSLHGACQSHSAGGSGSIRETRWQFSWPLRHTGTAER